MKVPRVAVECKRPDGSLVLPGADANGKLTVRPSVEPNDIEIVRYELFVDGLRDGNCAPGETMELDANNLAEGYHELGVVAVAKEQPQTQGRAVLPFHVPRGEPKLTVTRPDGKGVVWDVTWDQQLAVAARLVGGKRILFMHNGRQVGVIEGATGAAKIDLKAVGQGRVAIVPVGVLAARGGKEELVYGDPVELDVRPPMPAIAC